MNIICKQWNEDFEVNDYHIEDILCLIKDAYGERAKEGISFATLNYTLDEFLRERTDHDYWFLAFDNENLLYGTARLTVWSNYGIICNFAVAPHSQGKHIGSHLLQAANIFAQERELDYILSSTAIKAVSSVNCHCNNGFQKVGISIGLNRDYSSYVFRNQISHSLLWNSKTFVKVRFALTYLAYRICKNSNGKNTIWGNLLKSWKIRL